MELLIEALHLTKTFGHVNAHVNAAHVNAAHVNAAHVNAAVDDLSLNVAAGEIYGLVGPDGAGKTTAMRLLCGALRPTQSKDGPVSAIRIAGYDLNKQTEQAREQIGYLPQRFSLYEELTVLENIRFFAETRGLAASQWRPRCMEILEFVGLTEFTGRRAGHLSGGMKQKLGLAAALVHQPRVLLLDEPTTGVDPVTRQDFWQLILRLTCSPPASSTPSVAVLVSTPYMDEAARCARVGFIRQGRILVEGAPADLCAGLEQNILELRGSPLALLRRLVETEEDVEGAQMFGDRLHLRVSRGKSEQVVSRLEQRIPQAGGEISSLRPVPAQLEDVFIALLEDPDRDP